MSETKLYSSKQYGETEFADPNIFVAQNGLKLRLKKVSKLVIVDAGRQIRNPKVPETFIADKERSEANPNDPDYLEEVQRANYDRSMLVVTTLFALGTEIVEMPAGLLPPDDDEWFEVLESLQISVPTKNKRLRYAAWLKYIALTGDDDEFNELVKAVFRISGMTTEADVQDAEDGFKSNQGHPSNTQLARTPNGRRRDSNREH